MQLDLLQKDQITTSSDSKTATPKKTRQSQKQMPLLEAAVPADTVLPPLPESLRPPFIADAVDEDEGDEDMHKAPGAFKTISEAAKILDVPQHVLRFWESRFMQIKPLKLHGGRRYYRPEDIDILSTIKHLLYKQGYTIKGAKKVFSSEKRPSLGKLAGELLQASPLATAVPIPDKQKNQLSMIRQELMELRETLKIHGF